MTERERWVVYPLLFLALGAALRDKLVDRTTAKSIVCQELTVVEEEPVGNQPVRVLARIGKTEATATSAAHGYLGVNGEVDVDGSLKVNGVVNAKQYAHQGMLVAPSLQSLPGIPLADLLRALQAAQARQQSNAQSPAGQPKEKPPAVAPDDAQKAAPPDSHADENAQPKK